MSHQPVPPQCSNAAEFDELLSGLIHERGEEERDGEGSSQQQQQQQQTQGQGQGQGLKFMFHTMDGQQEDLCPEGSQREITYVSHSSMIDF